MIGRHQDHEDESAEARRVDKFSFEMCSGSLCVLTVQEYRNRFLTAMSGKERVGVLEGWG